MGSAVTSHVDRSLRDPVVLVCLVFAAGIVLLAARGDLQGAFELLAGLSVVVIARLLRVPPPFEGLFALGMSLEAVGNMFGLFGRYGWYDTLVHFALTMVAAPAAFLTLVQHGVIPPPTVKEWRRPQIGVVLITFLIGAGIEVVWEIYEFGVDQLTGGRLQTGNADTVGDLAASGAGALLGGQLLVTWLSAVPGRLRPGELA